MITLRTNETIYIGLTRDGLTKTLSAIPTKGATFAFNPLTTEEYYEATDLISKIFNTSAVSPELVKTVLKFAKEKVVAIHNTVRKADSFTFDTYFPLFKALYEESKVNEEEDLFLD